MAKIDNVDLGIVSIIEKYQTKMFNELIMPGNLSVYSQNMVTQKHEWRIEGAIRNPTQTTLEDLENIRNHGLICFGDFSDTPVGFYGWGKIAELKISAANEEPNLLRYMIVFRFQSAIGLSHSRTSDVYLHDGNYRAKQEFIDPHFGKQILTYSTNRLMLDYVFYVNNTGSGTQIARVEVHHGDDLSTLKLEGYKNSAWSALGTWGSGATAWGGTLSWIDQGTITHSVIAATGARGAVLASGTVSRTLGCAQRVLISIADLHPETTSHVYTDYAHHQLLLKLTLTHTARDALRPLPHVTYVEGGLEAGSP